MVQKRYLQANMTNHLAVSTKDRRPAKVFGTKAVRVVLAGGNQKSLRL